MSVTVYGRVTEIEPTTAPTTPPPEPPPEEILDPQLAMLRHGFPRYVPPVPKALLEGETPPEPPLNWVHVHILLDAPHTGELQVDAPESHVSGMLEVGSRARVTVSSN